MDVDHAVQQQIAQVCVQTMEIHAYLRSITEVMSCKTSIGCSRTLTFMDKDHCWKVATASRIYHYRAMIALGI
ncbi:unnamed protein product [Urochloa humidicola]